MESLTDGWWLGFQWRFVAKLLFVQNRLLVEDGWKVPRCFFKYLVENALRLEETREPPASSSEDLQRLLFEGAQWLCKKLPKVTRRPCVVCGKPANTLYRPCVRRGEARPPLSQVYCSQCFPLEEDSAHHSTIADIPTPWGTDDESGFVHQDVTIATSSPASSSDSSDQSDGGEGHGEGGDLLEAESGETLASGSAASDYDHCGEAPVCENDGAMVSPQFLSVDLLGLSGFLCSLSLDLEDLEISWNGLCRAGARALAILPCQVGFAWEEGRFTRQRMPELLGVDSNAVCLSVVRESRIATSAFAKMAFERWKFWDLPSLGDSSSASSAPSDCPCRSSDSDSGDVGGSSDVEADDSDEDSLLPFQCAAQQWHSLEAALVPALGALSMSSSGAASSHAGQESGDSTVASHTRAPAAVANVSTSREVLPGTSVCKLVLKSSYARACAIVADEQVVNVAVLASTLAEETKNNSSCLRESCETMSDTKACRVFLESLYARACTIVPRMESSVGGCCGSFKDSLIPTTPGIAVAAVRISPPRERALPLRGKRERRWVLDGSRWVLAPHAQPVKTRPSSPDVPCMEGSKCGFSQSFKGLPIYLCLEINSYLGSWIAPSILHRVPEGGPVVYPLLGRCRAVPFIEMCDARLGARAVNHAGASDIPAVCKLVLKSLYARACAIVAHNQQVVNVAALSSILAAEPETDRSCSHESPEAMSTTIACRLVLRSLYARACAAVPRVERPVSRLSRSSRDYVLSSSPGAAVAAVGSSPPLECGLDYSVCRLALNAVYAKAQCIVAAKERDAARRRAASLAKAPAPVRKPLVGEAPVPRSWFRGAGPARQRAMLRHLRGLGWGPRASTRGDRRRRSARECENACEACQASTCQPPILREDCDCQKCPEPQPRAAPPLSGEPLVACVVECGDEFCGWRRKCLQSSLHALAGGLEQQKLLRSILTKACGNHRASGGVSDAQEALNFDCTEACLKKVGVFAWVVEADSRTALASGAVTEVEARIARWAVSWRARVVYRRGARMRFGWGWRTLAFVGDA